MLFLLSTGKPSAIVVPKIVAFAGETVLLPCNITPSGDVPTVEWTKESSLPDIAFLYRDGCETFEMKNPVFRYRTNLIRHELHNGNLSMVISNLQISDSGKYHCAIIRKKKKVITTLELFVGTSTQRSELHLISLMISIYLSIYLSGWKVQRLQCEYLIFLQVPFLSRNSQLFLVLEED